MKGKRIVSLLLCLVLTLGLFPGFTTHVNAVEKGGDAVVSFNLGLSVKDAAGKAIANGLESATISCYGTTNGSGPVKKYENQNALGVVNNEEFLSDKFIPAGYGLPVTLTFKPKSPYQLADTKVTVTNPNDSNKEVATGTAAKNQDGSYTVTLTPAGVTEDTPRLSINLVLKYKDSEVAFDLGLSVKDAAGKAIANGLESATISCYGTPQGTGTVQKYENQNALGTVNDENGYLDFIAAGYDLPVTLTFKPKSPYQLADTKVTVTNPNDKNKEVATGTAAKNPDGSYTVTLTPAGVTKDTPRLSINLVLKYKDADVSFDLGLSVKDAAGKAIANGLESATISCYGTPQGTGTVQKYENQNALGTVNDENGYLDFIAAGYDLPVTLTFKPKSPYQLADTKVTVTNPNDKNKEVATGTAAKNPDGSYTVTLTPAGVTEDTPRLSINLVLKTRTYANVILETYAPVKVTKLTDYFPSLYAHYFYNPATQSFDNADYKDFTKYYVQLPVGEPLTADDLQAAGITTGQAVVISSSASQPTGTSKIDGWKIYHDSGVPQLLVEGYVISAEDAEKISTRKYPWFSAYALTEWPITVTFDTKGTSKTFEPLNFTVGNKKSPSGVNAEKPNEEQKQEIQEINRWVKEQTESTSFGYVFRGWYPNEKYTDKNCGDASTYDLPEYYWTSMDLHAKWVKKCTVSFDMNQVEVSNASDFSAYNVGKGESLIEPSVRPQASNATAAFEGWYKDKECKTKWDFEKDTVQGNTTLYAKWNKGSREVTVQFFYYLPDDFANENPQALGAAYEIAVSDGYKFGPLPTLPGTETKGDSPICDENGTPKIGPDGKLLYPITYRLSGNKRGLIYTGWAFTGMYGEVDLNENTVLADSLAEDVSELKVYAKSSIFVTFTFDTQGGTPIPEPQVADDCKAYMPESPTKGETKFLGWYEDKEGKTKFSFEKAYNQNMTVYAVWEKEKECKLIFDISQYPEATVVLKKGEEACTSTTQDGKVIFDKLARGTYQYTITLAGHKTLIGSREITDASPDEETIEVKNWPDFVSVAEITLNLPKNQIMQKKSYDLSSLATVAPKDASNKTIAWTVSGNDGVTLSEDGKTLTVSDAATGSVTLTATIANGTLNEDGTTEEDYTEPFALTIVPYQPTISFNAGTGPAAEDITGMPAPVLAENGKISAPTAPAASGWTFEGWYLDTACKSAWTADHEFSADATLYAKWTKNPVAVTITFAGGEGAVLNTGASGEHKGMSGNKITRPACMYTKPGYIFRSWDGTYAGTEYTLPVEAKTFTAQWTQITSAIVADDINHALDGISADNAKDYKPQLLAARDALMTGTATKTDAALIGTLSALFKSAGLGSVTISGDANQNAAETGAILSSDGSAVVLNINKQTTAGKSLPTAYQNEEYKSTWRTISMTVGGATTDPKVPVILSLPIPTELSGMAADTIRVLAYKGAATEPVVLTPTVSDGKLTFGFDGNGTFAFVGKEISDAADTRVTALVMKYNGTKMGNVEQDASGNFTVTLPSTTSESILQDLSSGINSKWLTYLTVAPQAKVKPSDGADQTAEYWANTGLALTYSLSSSNSYSQTRSFTVTAANGATRTFTVTVKKITDADRNYKIAVSNINGGTVTATPSPAAAGEEVKLTVTPNDGKKLVAGSLKYSLQSAGAAPVAIDESSLTFIMPAGDININAQFEDDASAPLKNPPQITAFMINGVSAVINSDTKAITIILPYGTDLRHVAPTIVTANASKVKPSSAQRVDLSTPKAYRVYASNGAYVTYTVTAYTEEPSPTQSLWEKLQNQINSSPNWWELAEYQKKAGYYR